MYICQKPVLHIVDSAAKSSASRFLADSSTSSAWTAFFECWGSVHTDLLNKIRVHHGSCIGDDFYTVASGARNTYGRSGSKAHSSLWIRKGFHKPLRNTFRKAKLSRALHILNSSTLSTRVKVMNDTLGPEGLVPSALVPELIHPHMYSRYLGN